MLRILMQRTHYRKFLFHDILLSIKLRHSQRYMSKKAVIFDFGGVLIPSPTKYVEKFAIKYELSPEQLNMLLFDGGDSSLWGRLECGEYSVEQFGRLLGERSKNLFGKALPDEVIIPISNVVGKSAPYPEMVAAIKQIRANGLKTALLTNNWDYGNGTVTLLDASLFDAVIESYVEKIRKPNPLIYKLALKRLNVLPSETVFIDDLGVNLKPAQGMGITTIKCVDTHSTLSELGQILEMDFGTFIPPGTMEVTGQHQLPQESLKSYLVEVLNLKDNNSPLVLRKFKHGQSNPTYYIRFGGEELVLRKKPPGKLLPSAHAVEREYRVMNALSEHGVPIPTLFGLCEDSSVVGTPFYIMKYLRGHVFKDTCLPDMSPTERRTIYSAMNKVLQKIHSVDLDKAGLNDFGKKGNYVLRTTKTWTKQYEASKTVDQSYMNKLIEWLPQNAPDFGKTTVVHGDFRIDNLIFNDKLEVIAVLDWELSTIGDPLSDLSYNCLPYYLPNDFPLLKGLHGTDLGNTGIPTEAMYVDEYAKVMNITKVTGFNAYMACTCFRLAAICQGVYKRSLQGQASSTTASQFGELVNMLAKIGCHFVDLEEKKDLLTAGTFVKNDASQFVFSVDGLPPRVQKMYEELCEFMKEEVYPQESKFMEETGEQKWSVNPVVEELKEKAKSMGLWNLFIPVDVDKDQEHGAGLTNLQYAFLCEQMGKVFSAPEIFNCSAPDTGNMEVLIKYGTAEQKEQWLKPLLNGTIRSCFGMTEPRVASSDASNIESSIVQDGDEYVINGRKWWTSGAMDSRCKLCIFMGKTDFQAPKHKQQSMILVPMDTPGVNVIRPLSVFGFYDAPAGHAEIEFKDVRVPIGNILVGEGKGFEIAQGRLGPGRIHHCMRLVGYAERALELMIARTSSRIAFGKPLITQGTIQADIANSRIEIEQARLLVLKAAHMMDTVGNRSAAADIAMIKVVAPMMAQGVIDRAIQAFGGAGLSQDTPLASLFTWARVLRLADGPDEVHKRSVARMEIKKYQVLKSQI